MKKQIDDEAAVGSFRPSVRDFGVTPPGSQALRSGPLSKGGDLTDARFPKGPVSETPDPKMLPNDNLAEEDEDEDQETAASSETGTNKGAVSTLDGLRQLFPSFSSSRYGRAHSGSGRRDVILPAGVKKPTQLIMYAGEVKVEAKVWLANQRTFIKWMHIVVMLASVSVALYNAADEGTSWPGTCLWPTRRSRYLRACGGGPCTCGGAR